LAAHRGDRHSRKTGRGDRSSRRLCSGSTTQPVVRSRSRRVFAAQRQFGMFCVPRAAHQKHPKLVGREPSGAAEPRGAVRNRQALDGGTGAADGFPRRRGSSAARSDPGCCFSNGRTASAGESLSGRYRRCRSPGDHQTRQPVPILLVTGFAIQWQKRPGRASSNASS
jgi:hypothetical protein